jgi:phosphate starvation-inducible protein PhoH and related proteins
MDERTVGKRGDSFGQAGSSGQSGSGRSDVTQTPQGNYLERAFNCNDLALLQTLLGEQDCHLKVIEERTKTSVGRVVDGLVVRGLDHDVQLAVAVLTQLLEVLQAGYAVFPGDVARAVRLLSANHKARLLDLFRDTIKIYGKKVTIVPKTFVQKQYLEAIKTHDIVFGLGPAGTGKTYLAMAMAVSALMQRQFKRVVLCRPAVEAGEKLGFLPGDMAEKVNPYLRPLYDALHDMVDISKAEEMMEKGQIEVAPLAFMRGRTLSDAFVILDEAQNTSESQMKMLLTRIGLGSKCVITGDTSQIDLPRGVQSGLVQATRILHDTVGIAMVEFGADDVVRHPIVARIIEAYGRAHRVRD